MTTFFGYAISDKRVVGPFCQSVLQTWLPGWIRTLYFSWSSIHIFTFASIIFYRWIWHCTFFLISIQESSFKHNGRPLTMAHLHSVVKCSFPLSFVNYLHFYSWNTFFLNISSIRKAVSMFQKILHVLVLLTIGNIFLSGWTKILWTLSAFVQCSYIYSA